MKKILYLFLLLLAKSALSQNVEPTNTCIKTNTVFDYFRQESDGSVFIVGSVALLPGDSISFIKNEYCIDSTQNNLKIYFKDKLLYSYKLHNGQIQGTGYCYYAYSSQVAVQGYFKNSKLDGLVFIQEENGKMIEVMEFKKGHYVKHIYHWLSPNKKSLKARSKNRSNNPLRGDEIIKV